MKFDNNIQKYIDYKVYGITSIKKKYGYRVVLMYSDGTTKTIQKSGFTSKIEANAQRNISITELHNNNFVIYDNVTIEEFFTHWLENEMKPRITANSYDSYKNIVYNHLIPFMGTLKMITLNRGHIQKFYNEKAQYSHNIARLCKAVMNTGLQFAVDNKVVGTNVAKDVNLPKCVKKKKYRTITIDSKKTLNLKQVKTLIEASKSTPIYLQVMFAVLMGLRKSEINGLKYEDIDYIHRTLSIQRQLGRKPNTTIDEIEKGQFTKQDIDVKTFSSNRDLEIPDILFEAILEEKKKYERNRSRRINDTHNPFKDLDYICCSTYGNPRSKVYHQKYYKNLLKDNKLLNIRFHDLRKTYCTLLVKNNFNLKAISNMMGHATEIISVDVYTDNDEIITDCLNELEPFIEKVIPINDEEIELDFTDDVDLVNTEVYMKELLSV